MHNQLITITEEVLKLPEGIINTESSIRIVCIGRYMIYRYLHEELKWSAGKVAKLFNRTRINVFRGIRVLRNQMQFDKDLRIAYTNIIQKIEDVTNATSSNDMEEKDY